MARTARSHSPEYLDQALRLIVDIGHTVEFVAGKLDISVDLLDLLLERKLAKAATSSQVSVDTEPKSGKPSEFVAASDLLAIARK